MTRTKLTDKQEFLKILYYGEPGRGKTTALAGMARLGPMVFVDAESGLKAAPLERLGVPIDQIEVEPAIRFKNLEELFWEIHQAKENGNSETIGVALDSVTEIQKKLLEQTVALAVKKTTRRGMERDIWTVNREDWGVNTEQLRSLIRKFRDLGCHVGFACLERRDVDDQDGAVKYGPALTPAIQNDLLGYVDVVCHCEAQQIGEETFYWGSFRPVGKYQGKDRYGMLPARVINPSFDRILAYINGEIQESTDAVLKSEQARARKAKAKEDNEEEGE